MSVECKPIAFCLHEQVDKHIRRLDSDLARFEAELKEKALDTNIGS
jgi:inhibitor of growth protein 4